MNLGLVHLYPKFDSERFDAEGALYLESLPEAEQSELSGTRQNLQLDAPGGGSTAAGGHESVLNRTFWRRVTPFGWVLVGSRLAVVSGCFGRLAKCSQQRAHPIEASICMRKSAAGGHESVLDRNFWRRVAPFGWILIGSCLVVVLGSLSRLAECPQHGPHTL